MIITITGKPCSGKGTVSKILCSKYNFEYICTGDMFRNLAKQYGYNSILEFQTNHKNIKEVDYIIDNQTIEIGKTRINENIVFDSRLAWHFIPNSFKVFIDIDWQSAGERLLNANRDSEKVETLDSAIQTLQSRWSTENERYMELYNTNNLNLNNYDCVISSKDLTPEQVAEKIYEEYQKFMQNA